MKTLLKLENILPITIYKPLMVLLDVYLTDIDIICITDNKN